MSNSGDAAKKKALELAMSHIVKQFGVGAIMSLGDHSANRTISSIKTGAISLDIALGIGGVPRGRVVEIYGPESSGKSTLAEIERLIMEKVQGVPKENPVLIAE